MAKRKMLVAVIIAVVALAVFLWSRPMTVHRLRRDPEKHFGKMITMCGEVDKLQKCYYRYSMGVTPDYYRFELVQGDDRMSVDTDNLKLKNGTRVRVTGRFASPGVILASGKDYDGAVVPY